MAKRRQPERGEGDGCAIIFLTIAAVVLLLIVNRLLFEHGVDQSLLSREFWGWILEKQ